ncbi:MAG: sulfatase-like hydrolase/transferase, partial [Planctomycetota bacterium]
RPSLWRVGLSALICLSVVSFLMVDCRARQLWLQPLSWDLAVYYLTSGEDMANTDIFFLRNAGFGMTFRKLLFLVLVAQSLLWSIVWIRGRNKKEARARRIVKRLMYGLLGLSICLSLLSRRYLYDAEANVLVRGAIDILRFSGEDDGELCQLALEFDQPPQPVSRVLQAPRQRLQDVKPFRNVIFFLLETFRWRGLGLESNKPNHAPNLRRFAREGLLAKAYVSIPHSSKATYAVLSGRHPYPGIEMRESLVANLPGLIWDLRENAGAETYCYSTMSLEFENLRGLLKGLGFQHLSDKHDLVPTARIGEFVHRDWALVGAPAETLGNVDGNFAALFITYGAHYPYESPGNTNGGIGESEYWKSVEHADMIINEIVASLGRTTALDDTLVVFVGDHGESFGKHGTFVHNNSLYEEEISVPLIFWAADGRVRHSETINARQVDIAPTVADLMGMRGGNYEVQGVSLLRELPELAYVSSFFDGVQLAMIRQAKDKWIFRPSSGQLSYYDLERDPGERVDRTVPNGPQRAEIVRRLKAFRAHSKTKFRKK